MIKLLSTWYIHITMLPVCLLAVHVAQNMPRLETLENCMRISQMMIQGLWDNKSPLLQLPHLNQENLRHFNTKKV